ncbi:hypothetical protein QBC39DRAFT_74101 [Podospora conica]|nr:hypothetical protein QBC39DRAFT_74101 [Schizothecium conicum]
MADNQPAEEQSPSQLERHLPRIRYLPDWEIPMNPPKRRQPLFSPAKLSRSVRRSRVAAFILPKPNLADTSRPTSDTSFQDTKESFADTEALHGGIAPLAGTPTSPNLSPRPLHRVVHTLPPRRYLGGHTRRTIVLIAVAILLALGLILGLGLGLGLHRDVKAADAQPADVQPASLPSPGPPSSSPLSPGPLPSSSLPPDPPPLASPFPGPPSPAPEQSHPGAVEGNLTYSSPGFGACGWTSSDTEYVCAIPLDLFGAAGPHASAGKRPTTNWLCGRMIRVTTFLPDSGFGWGILGNTAIERSVDVRVVDSCAACGPTDLDLSPGAFGRIAPDSTGMVHGKWEWL